MIKKISIKNVKGISSLSVDVDLPANKPAILVAPNGFGKTSITTAFRSLNRNRLLLAEENLYNGLATNRPELSIETVDENGQSDTLIADDNQNQIARIFDVDAIGSLAYPKATKKNMGRFTAVSAAFVIDPIILVPTIPEKSKFDYRYATGKLVMLCLGKFAPNLSFLKDHESFFANSEDAGLFDAIQKMGQVRQRKKISDFFERAKDIVDNNLPDEVVELITTTELDNLRDIQQLKVIADYVSSFDFCEDETHSYLIALELSAFFYESVNVLASVCRYANYTAQKKELTQIFKDFNSSKQNFSPKEQGGALVLNFPKLHQISNGQRDVLSFVAALQRVKKGFKKDALILVIDEVFDYLDEANLVAAQYYLSKFIAETKEAGKEIYPVIMTHLAPELFGGYVFGGKLKLQVRYLKKFPNVTPDSMRLLLRERANKTSPLKFPIENKLLHFHDQGINLRVEFSSAGLKPTWGDPGVFYQYVDDELAKYLAGANNYDPIAICCAVRIKIERQIYEKINGADNKRKFLDEVVSGTSDKLDFATDLGVQIPESYYLLGVVYNEGLHWRDDTNFTSRIVARLENVTIKNMITGIGRCT